MPRLTVSSEAMRVPCEFSAYWTARGSDRQPETKHVSASSSPPNPGDARRSFIAVNLSLRHVDAHGVPGVILPDIRQVPGERRGLASAPDAAGSAMRTATHAMRLCVPAVLLGIAWGIVHAETTGALSQTQAADFRAQFKDSLGEMPAPSAISARGTIYVPAYSRVYGGTPGDRKLIELSTTLRIDNTSSTKALVLERVEYFDTAGKLVQSYLSEPMALKPFGTIEIVIPAEDDRGGVAANFIVEWAGNGPIAEPLIEAVMIGAQDNTSYSFVSPGRPIRNVGKSPWFNFRLKF
jgi:hypothetical protein